MKLGDVVKIKTDYLYKGFCFDSMEKAIDTYISRYKPINVTVNSDTIEIHTQKGSLLERCDLVWKVRYVIENVCILSSNENHMLIVNAHKIEF